MKYLSSLLGYMKKHKGYVIGVVVVAIVVSAGYKYISAPKTVAVTTTGAVPVSKGDISVEVTGTGAIVPIASANVVAKASGTVKKVYVKNGDHVKKGQTLVELEDDSLAMQIAKARLAIRKAELSSEDTFETSTNGVVTASFAGRITSIAVNEGSEVSNNGTLASLQDDSQLIFYMPISSKVLNKVKANQTVQVVLPDRGDFVEGKIDAASLQDALKASNNGRVYLKVAIPTTGNLTTGNTVFGTLTINGQEVDALATSTLEWLKKGDVKSTLAGKITAIYVKEGQLVSKGQPLFALNNSSAVNQQKTSQLSIDEAKLSLQELENEEKYLIVTSTIDGVLTNMNLKEGNEVTVSSNSSSSSTSNDNATAAETTVTLGKVITTDHLKVSFPVDEVDIEKVKLGQTAVITADALAEKKFQGIVTEIDQEGSVSNNVSSFGVTIQIDNDQNLLKSGMTANVSITSAEKKGVLLVPVEALQEKGKQKYVMVPSSNGQNKRQKVSVGLINDSNAEIISGLKEGDKVLVTGETTTTQNTNRSPFGMGATRTSGNRARND